MQDIKYVYLFFQVRTLHEYLPISEFKLKITAYKFYVNMLKWKSCSNNIISVLKLF